MAFFKTQGIQIAGMSCAVPENLVPAESFIPVFGEEVVEKFIAGTGIHSIYRALPEQTAGDLACAAACDLLEKMDVSRDEIGALLFVTQSPDYRRPATACVLQSRLGLSMDCAAMDIGLGCSGFVYGLQTAMSMMAQSDMKYALVLLGETASKLVNPMDKTIAMMYGDAGAAVLLSRDARAQTSTLLKSDGKRFKTIILPAGGFRDMNPPHERFMCSDGVERSLYDIYMDGTSVLSFSISDVPESLRDYVAFTGVPLDGYDAFVFHQANYFIIKQIIRRMKIDRSKVPVSLDRYGNTGGISIPLTLCDAFGTMPSGERSVLMCGFGIGLSWGVTSALLRLENVFPVIQTNDYFAGGRILPGSY